MEFWRYYRIIRRRRWLIILGTLAAVLAVWSWNISSEKLYVARTVLAEPTPAQGMGVPIFQSQLMTTTVDVQLQLSNLGNIATSQTVMQRAYEALLDLGLKFTPEQILRATSVTPVRDTSFLAIEVTLPDPKDAKVAADCVAAAFKNVYADLNSQSVTQSRQFIEDQIASTHEAMVKAQDALRRYKEQHGVVEVNQQLAATVQKVAQAQTNAAQMAVNRQAAAARVEQARREVASLPEWEDQSKSVARNPVWERLKEQLVDLETKKAGMLNGVPGQTRRGVNHPEVVALQAQIDDVKRQLLDVKEEYVASSTTAKSQPYNSALVAYLNAKVEDVATDAQQAAAEAVVREMKAEWQQLPEQEAKVAELTADLKAATDTYTLMKSKLDEARIREQENRSQVALNTIDPATVRPLDQKHALKLILALILSPLMGIGVAFLLHYTDNTVKTPADAEKLLGLPVLTAVPSSKAHSLPRQTCPEITDVAYQMLTSNLWIASQNGDTRSLVVVSAEPDSGRSVTASNLAVSLAREGAKVILVDADLRKPTQHLIFGVENKIGLTNVLSGAATLEDALVPTRIQGLLLVPSGPIPSNPVKLLRSAEMKDFVAQVHELADFVIYDTPAGVTFPDPTLVAAMVGNALVVQAAGRVPRGSEAEFSARMQSVGVRLLGVVLNMVRREDSSGYFHYHRSYEGVGIPQLAAGKKAMKGSGTGA